MGAISNKEAREYAAAITTIFAMIMVSVTVGMFFGSAWGFLVVAVWAVSVALRVAIAKAKADKEESSDAEQD